MIENLKARSQSYMGNIVTAFIAIVVAATLCFPHGAFAKQTDNDIVAGYSAAQRGLTATNMPSITAKCAYVVDSDGNVYFERNADKESQIASVTKMMTCIVALENADIDKKLVVSERAATIGESTAHLAKGDVLDLKTALIGLMVPSGNDAATTIAENVGEDIIAKAKADGSQITDAEGNPIDLDKEDAPYKAFVAKMNEKAKEIGMTNSLFTNPHGLDIKEFKGEKLHSTARDVSTMSVYGMQNPTFREIVSLGDTNIVVKRGDKDIKIKLEGTDTLIGSYEGACGIKTGYTEGAGGCFSGAVLRDGKYLYAVVLGASSNEQKLDDAKTIYQWVYGNQTDFPLVNTDESHKTNIGGVESDAPVLAEVPLTEWTDKTVKVTVKDPSKTVKVNAIFGNVSQVIREKEITGDVKAGDIVGAIEYFQGNDLVASEDLISLEDVDSPGFIDAAIIGLQRLIGSFNGASDHADVKIFNKTEPILLKS